VDDFFKHLCNSAGLHKFTHTQILRSDDHGVTIAAQRDDCYCTHYYLLEYTTS
jgi:hypothetical protein